MQEREEGCIVYIPFRYTHVDQNVYIPLKYTYVDQNGHQSM